MPCVAIDPPVPAPLGIYAVALDVALTSASVAEREGARRLIRGLGAELFGNVPRRPRSRSAFGRMIEAVLDERLGGAIDLGKAAA